MKLKISKENTLINKLFNINYLFYNLKKIIECSCINAKFHYNLFRKKNFNY